MAVEEGLEWREGTQELVEAMAAKQQCPIIHVAAEYGLPWSNYMKELVESNTKEIAYQIDSTTSLLRLFMLAAMGRNSDLSTVYGMMKMSPS